MQNYLVAPLTYPHLDLTKQTPKIYCHGSGLVCQLRKCNCLFEEQYHR